MIDESLLDDEEMADSEPNQEQVLQDGWQPQQHDHHSNITFAGSDNEFDRSVLQTLERQGFGGDLEDEPG